MQFNDHENIMLDLKSQHDFLLPIFQNKKTHYLDIPIHNNIGDLLIMLGTLRFFKENKIKTLNISSAIDYHFPKIPKNDVISLHGGGNLGDLYLLHQNFREDVIQQYPDNPIIIFPQTIYFENDKNYQKCCEIFSTHKDLHICVRDQHSYELALKMSKNVYLLPDMAHQLYPLKTASLSFQKKILFIKRTDKEACHIPDSIFADTTIDWPELLGNKIKFTQKVERNLRRSLRKKRPIKRKFWVRIWILYSNHLANKAIHIFNAHESVITNRLHAHILSCLMDKKNLVIDNSYGKNSSYIKKWTVSSELVSQKAI